MVAIGLITRARCKRKSSLVTTAFWDPSAGRAMFDGVWVLLVQLADKPGSVGRLG